MSDQRKRSNSYPIVSTVKPRPQEPLHESILGSAIDTSRVPDLRIKEDVAPDSESYMAVYRMGRMVGEDYSNMGSQIASLIGEFEAARLCRIHILPNNSFQGSRSSELEHWLSVVKEQSGFVAYESGDPAPVDETRRLLLQGAFYGRKPILMDYDLGTRMVFENLDMDDRRCTIFPIGGSEREGKSGSLAVIPMYYRDKARLLGIAEFEGDLKCRGSGMDGLERNLFTAHAAMVAALQISYALTHKMDAITDLSKVVDYEKDFKQGISQLAEHKIKSLWHIMMDVDNFKMFNDRYGHDVGDLVLRSVAETIKISVRSNDIAYRVGGEEFSVLLRDVNEQEAGAIAERIRENIAKMQVKTAAGELGVTVSMGLLRVNDALSRVRLPMGHGGRMHDVMIDFVYEQAKKGTEKGLREAKGSGKNRVCRCEPEQLTPVVF